jgi:hypothetical protein
MTKHEFIQAYIRETGVTNHFRRTHYVCLPCHCGRPWCDGWAHVSNTPEKIQYHWDHFVNQPKDDEIAGLNSDDWEIFGLNDEIEGLFENDEIAGLEDDEIAGLEDDEIAGLEDDDEIEGL